MHWHAILSQIFLLLTCIFKVVEQRLHRFIIFSLIEIWVFRCMCGDIIIFIWIKFSFFVFKVVVISWVGIVLVLILTFLWVPSILAACQVILCVGVFALNLFDICVSEAVLVPEDVFLDTGCLVMERTHMVSLKIVSWNWIAEFLFQLFKVLSGFSRFSDVHWDGQTVECMLLIFIVEVVPVNSWMISINIQRSTFFPFFNGWSVSTEMSVVRGINLHQQINFIIVVWIR